MQETVYPLPITANRRAVRYSANGQQRIDDVVATEYALTIYVNNDEMATIVCTPSDLEDLVVGFLASEGVIRDIAQLEDLSIVASRGVARARITGHHNFNQSFYNKRYIASCCGKSRQSFYFYNDAHTAKTAEDDGVRFHPTEIIEFMEQLENASTTFRETGGVHSAGICSQNDGLMEYKSDIGRHNALDKLYGSMLRHQSTRLGSAIAFTGRLSSEVLLKAAKIGVGLIAAKSAPTALALDMANELNITAIGFARQEEFSVYTHPWRVAP